MGESIMVMKVDIRAKGFKEFFDNIARDIAEEIYNRSQDNIDRMGVIASGKLKKSGMVSKVGENSYVVKYYMPYSIYVEYGTRPHRPPVRPLIEWAMIKLKMNEKDAKKTAWAIAKKIEKYGTVPRPFLRAAIDSVMNDILMGNVKVREMNLEFRGGK